jgi:hypothetical protein
MGKTPKPPAPDPRLGEAALRQARVAEEMFTLSREQMAHQRQQDARNYALATDQFNYQKGILDQQMGWARDDRQREVDVFRPLQDQIISDARGWDSQENMARRAGQAQSDVQQAIGQQNQATARMMTQMGVNPNSGRMAGAMRGQAFSNAALQAGAANQTRSQLLNEAQSLRHSAAGLGNPLLGASYGALTSAGQTAGGLMDPYLKANQMALTGFSTGMQGMGQGAQANQGAFDMYNKMYQNQLDVWKTKAANRAALTSSVIGLAGAAFGGPLGGALGAGIGSKLVGAGSTTVGAAGNTFWQNFGAGMLPQPSK